MLPHLNAFLSDYHHALVKGRTLRAFSTALNAAYFFEERDDFESAGVWHREASFTVYLHFVNKARSKSRESTAQVTALGQKVLSLLNETKRQALHLNFYESYKALIRAEEIARPVRDDDALQAEIQACKAFCFTRAGDAQRAIFHYETAVRLMLNAGEFRRAAGILNSLGFWSTVNRQFQRGEQYLLHGLELATGQVNQYMQVALSDSLGFTYGLMRRYSDTERFLVQSSKLLENSSDALSRISSILRLAAFQAIMKNHQAASDLTNQAVLLATDAQCEPLLAQAQKRLLRLERPYQARPAKPKIFHDLLYVSAQMQEVLSQIKAVAPTSEVVLILGETGVGKELLAHAIHQESKRRPARFIPFNCSAVSRELVEGRLFGHRKGAFTGADRDHEGIIRAANGGTLFLDEIGNLPMEAQGALLRFLQAGEVQPLGESRPVKVDVRVIAATNCDLSQAVEKGGFRKDLYHRLNVVTLVVPPLRSRPEDVLILARHFGRLHSATYERGEPEWSAEEIRWLTQYAWPGNVRELENYVKQRILFGASARRMPARAAGQEDNLDHAVCQPDAPGAPAATMRVRSWRKLDEMEKQAYLLEALNDNGGNVSAAARQLGISRRAVQKLRQRSINRDTLSTSATDLPYNHGDTL